MTQTSLGLVAANVANAETPGYVRKTPTRSRRPPAAPAPACGSIPINRELDKYVQRQLRTETSGGAYADTRAPFYQRLQQVYGEPGSSTSLDTVFNNFTGAVQALATSPDSTSAQTNVLSTAQVLAQQLNSMTPQSRACAAMPNSASPTDVQPPTRRCT